MKNKLQQMWITSFVLVLLLAGCAAPQAPTVSGATPVSAPTSTMAAASPTAEATAAPSLAATPSASAEIPNSALSPGDIQYTIVPAQSEARYRLREQLANVSLPNDAIGKTNQVSGSVVLKPDGAIDSANSQFVVDVSTLQSDRSQRDNYVRRNVLGTSQYPTVTFVPAQVTGLPSPLPESGPVNFQLAGDLTIKDVTKPVTWQVTGTINGDQATGQAQTSFKFADFNLTQPRVPIVLSVEDNITLELDLTLLRSVGSPAAAPSNDPTTTMGQPPLTCTSPVSLTPAMTEGPYYKAGSPEQTNLFQPAMAGTKLMLNGYVLNTACQPVANAWLDFWQADSQGQYDNAGYTLRGHQMTDANGYYHLETVVPGLYPGRTEHIHVKVQPPNGAVLTTQLFFPDVAQNQSDQIFDPALLLNIQETSDGIVAAYNFVVPN